MCKREETTRERGMEEKEGERLKSREKDWVKEQQKLRKIK